MSATHVQGFTALPVKYKSSCRGNHWIYCKEHSVREKIAGKPAGCTLFVVNVPPYFTEDCLRRLFEDCGSISAVHFHQKPSASLPPMERSQFFQEHPLIKGFKVAYVVFDLPSGLQKALKLNWNEPRVIWVCETKLPSAVDRWKAQYDKRIPDVSELQADIDSFMKQYDLKVAEEEKKFKETEGQPDDEGWVTVTRKGRKPGFARKESLEQQIKAKESKKKSKKELLNFYSFQIRESKMKHLAELRNKFEEDKKKIATMRQSRRFKPF